MSSTAPFYQHEKEYNPDNDKQNVHKPIDDSKTLRFGVVENEVINADDWNNRWITTHAGRWQLSGVHPFLLRHAHLFRDWDNRANKTILVPLCGKSDDLFWLAQTAGLKRVIGIESSSVAIKSLLEEYECTRISENIECYSALAGKLIIYCGDLFDKNINAKLLGGGVDYIWDRAALVALHWKDHDRYMKQLLSFQGESVGQGKYDILIGAYWHTQHRGPPFDVDLAHLQRLFGEQIKVEQLEEIDAFYSGWQNGGFTDMVERLYGVELPTVASKTRLIRWRECSTLTLFSVIFFLTFLSRFTALQLGKKLSGPRGMIYSEYTKMLFFPWFSIAAKHTEWPEMRVFK